MQNKFLNIVSQLILSWEIIWTNSIFPNWKFFFEYWSVAQQKVSLLEQGARRGHNAIQMSHRNSHDVWLNSNIFPHPVVLARWGQVLDWLTIGRSAGVFVLISRNGETGFPQLQPLSHLAVPLIWMLHRMLWLLHRTVLFDYLKVLWCGWASTTFLWVLQLVGTCCWQSRFLSHQTTLPLRWHNKMRIIDIIKSQILFEKEGWKSRVEQFMM